MATLRELNLASESDIRKDVRVIMPSLDRDWETK